ncbi:glycerol-3-phosphate phosphatase-like isoform X2 [Octopus bimaculoides]|uniref:glycerol-3-phosphate phosphatase-like isoform X2 n=1 Tax=Octopus bimaculoides TaxID=37653 RepID=UPI0022E28931|nr:glycerol-3-phosphate phosphatase-like isoform X2 [Octopus bimaculoides]
MSTSKSLYLDGNHMNYLLAHVDTFLFDCDGVLWRHLEPIPGASDTVKKLKKLGKNVFFVTNNSSKSRKDYCIKFSQLGFEVKESEIISTAYIAALYLHERNFRGKVYLVGSKGIADELDNFGIQHTEVGIKCVLVGFDQHISYMKILKAASYIKKKKCLFIATNEDSNLPIPGDVIIPGTGTMVSAVKIPSQTNPVVIGKPHPVIIELLKKRDGLNPSRALMVGDRLNTDIAFAKNHKLKSLLVLSGISNLEDIQEAEKNPSDENPYPDYYLPSLAEFSQLLPN